MFAANVTFCVLFYGAEQKHFNLARRVLNPQMQKLAYAGGKFCFGCNAVGEDTSYFLQQQISNCFYNATTIVSDRNIYKYPMMRRMLREHKIDRQFVVWFDHDSYIDSVVDVEIWINRLKKQLTVCDVVGSVNRGKLDCASTSTLSTGAKRKAMSYVQYPNASWWAAKTNALIDMSWPPPHLGQKNGDVLFGHYIRQHQLSLCHFRDGVKINVNDVGVEAAASRTIVS